MSEMKKEKKETAVNEINDTLAEKLEQAGLWRRAAARWLDVMLMCETDTLRDQVRRRRNACLSRLSSPVLDKKLDIHGINRAASLTQDRMGLSRPKGAAFRKYPKPT